MTTSCDYCTAAAITNGLNLCQRCQQTARTALDNIGNYHPELLSLGAKQRIRTKRSGISNPTMSTALEDLEPETHGRTPAEIAADARTTLITWSRKLNDDTREVITASMVGVIRGLQRQLPTIARQEWAAEFVEAMLDLERTMRRPIERAKGSWYAGICGAIISDEKPHDGLTCACACHRGSAYTCDIPGGCGLEFGTIAGEICEAELFATPGHHEVRCKHCGTRYDVKARRDTLLTEMRETTLPLTVIAHVCVAMLDGEPSVEKFRKRLEKWTERGHLIWVANDGPTKLYRVGDVLDLQIEHARDPRGWIGRRAAV